VTVSELGSLGGDPNRLYQSLVERKGFKSKPLELDLLALTAVSARGRGRPLSKKQMKELTKRKLEAQQRIVWRRIMVPILVVVRRMALLQGNADFDLCYFHPGPLMFHGEYIFPP